MSILKEVCYYKKINKRRKKRERIGGDKKCHFHIGFKVSIFVASLKSN